MRTILVIGASGFVGRRLAQSALAQGQAVRCMPRDPARVADLAAAGCEVVQGNVSDAASIGRALAGVDAAVISIHTLSPQGSDGPHRRFMDVEIDGLRNIVAAARTHGVRRLVYVTSIGTTPDASSEWLRERWRAEQMLLDSGLDVTVIRPGQIVGRGGRGFDMIMANAKRPVALMLGGGRRKMPAIAVDDLVYYLLGVLDDPRSFGQRYDVGGDDALTVRRMTDIAAETLGRRHPVKISIPLVALRALAPLFERAGKAPKGAIKGFVDSMGSDLASDPLPIRAILPRPLVLYRDAVKAALATE